MSTYFVLFSDTSRNGTAGLTPRVSIMTTEKIIECAEAEMRRSGESFESMAGIRWVLRRDGDGNLEPRRELRPAEILALAVEKLGDDGRMFQIFDADSADATARFIVEAAYHCLEEEARELVEREGDPSDALFLADDLIADHALEIARAEEQARVAAEERTAARRAHLEHLPVVDGCPIEKGKYGAHNWNGYRVYQGLENGCYRRCALIYSRELPEGLSPDQSREAAVALAKSRWAESVNA